MTRQKFRTILVEGFTSLKEVSLELNDLNVVVGANGAGKSNLIKALEMLGRIIDGELGLFTGIAGGASASGRPHRGRAPRGRIGLRTT